MSRRDDLFAYLLLEHPRSLRGVQEARDVDPERFDRVADRFLGWAEAARGADYLSACADAMVRFSNDVILAQARYEATGAYEHSSFDHCNDEVYGKREVMDDYLWGVFLTNFCWAHHMEISAFYEDRFLARLPASPAMVEIAPGHGGWGVWAMHTRADASLQGFDISPSSIAIASSVAQAAGVSDRVTYTQRNALDLSAMPEGIADAVICSFLIEHLEQPDDLMAVIGRLLKPGGWAFVTGALTAAQVDHIYEFRRESELVLMAEKHGLRVCETLSVSPKRILPKAKFLPRSMALLCQRTTHGFW
ncbi:MAG: methyltransferase domain-containing protein [Alphaproteobacteria bacterium]|nr:methyltransferase domain-containing protein [Alphaproteobacteria bacterium]